MTIIFKILYNKEGLLLPKALQPSFSRILKVIFNSMMIIFKILYNKEGLLLPRALQPFFSRILKVIFNLITAIKFKILYNKEGLLLTWTLRFSCTSSYMEGKGRKIRISFDLQEHDLSACSRALSEANQTHFL